MLERIRSTTQYDRDALGKSDYRVANDLTDGEYDTFIGQDKCDPSQLCLQLKDGKRKSIATDFPFLVRDRLASRLMQLACQGPVEDASLIMKVHRNTFSIDGKTLFTVTRIVDVTCETILGTGFPLHYSIVPRELGPGPEVIRTEATIEARLPRLQRIDGRFISGEDVIVACGTDQPRQECRRDEGFDLPCLRVIQHLLREMSGGLRKLQPVSLWRFTAIVDSSQVQACIDIARAHNVPAQAIECVRRRRL